MRKVECIARTKREFKSGHCLTTRLFFSAATFVIIFILYSRPFYYLALAFLFSPFFDAFVSRKLGPIRRSVQKGSKTSGRLTRLRLYTFFSVQKTLFFHFSVFLFCMGCQWRVREKRWKCKRQNIPLNESRMYNKKMFFNEKISITRTEWIVLIMWKFLNYSIMTDNFEDIHFRKHWIYFQCDYNSLYINYQNFHQSTCNVSDRFARNIN